MAGETLRVVIGAAAGTEIPLGDEFTLGRTETAEGNLGGDPELSRRHATIRRRPDGGLEIEDLNSTNGTHVNGVRITGSHPLNAGDTIRIGQTTINVHAEAPATGPGAGATVIGAAPPMPPGGLEPPPPAPVEPPAPLPPDDPGKGPSVPEPESPAFSSGDPLGGPQGDPLRDESTQIDQPTPFGEPPPDDATRIDSPPPTPPTEAYPPPQPAYEQPQYGQQPGYEQQQYGQQAYPEQYQQQQPAAYAQPAEGLALKRPLARVIVLAFLTFGIYAYYWFWITREQLNRETGKNENAIMILVPIYNIIFIYNMYQDLSYARQRIGQAPLSTGEIILAMFIWPYGTYLMNQYWDARTGGQATDAPIAGGERLIIIIGIGFFLLCCVGCVGLNVLSASG